jgi:hypothetical protein
MRNRRGRATAWLVMGALSCGLMFSSPTSVSPQTPADDGRTGIQSQACDGRGSGYTVREIRYGQALMREFIAPSGVVFALDWRRMPEPDLKNLLGSSTDDDRPANVLPIFGLRDSTTEVLEGDIILDESYAPGDSRGHAYVPWLVPSGVTIRDAWCKR